MNTVLTAESKGTCVLLDTERLELSVRAHGRPWRQDMASCAYVELTGGGDAAGVRVDFGQAGHISHSRWESGVGRGIVSDYRGFAASGEPVPLELRTKIWVDDAFGRVFFELIVLKEEAGRVQKIVWPGPFVMEEKEKSCYTVLPMRQGILIPNGHPKQVESIFEGRFHTMGFYMPWWGQVRDKGGFLAIAETPWDGGCDLKHPAGGPTEISPAWRPSLGKMDYRRVIRYEFLESCDYNALCKKYREYVKERGSFVPLEQKALRNPKINRLIGSYIVTDSIYMHIEPESIFYKTDDPAYNDRLTTFEEMAGRLARLKALGAGKVYFHMDGWGSLGYDNLHPDILPPCEKAGGWRGMKRISDVCGELGYLFALHDEYINFYKKAPSYRDDLAVLSADGRIPTECIWFGGEQALLCSHVAPHYLRRNYAQFRDQGIRIDGTYLDGFTAAPVSECAHPEHRMTRRECLEKRRECFAHQTAQGFLVSSEEAADALLDALDLVHHAPYGRGQGEEPFDTGDVKGVPVPLFNLVYHDCLIVPWSMGKGAPGIPPNDDGFLHGLLNGGLPYLGSCADREEIEARRVMCRLHERVARQELIRHEFLDGAGRRQRTTFADGTIVEVDFEADTYSITPQL